jgi:hypothetical protein
MIQDPVAWRCVAAKTRRHPAHPASAAGSAGIGAETVTDASRQPAQAAGGATVFRQHSRTGPGRPAPDRRVPAATKRRRWRLSTRIVLSQLAVLLVVAALGLRLNLRLASDQLNQQYEQRSLAVAQAVADMPAGHLGAERNWPSLGRPADRAGY